MTHIHDNKKYYLVASTKDLFEREQESQKRPKAEVDRIINKNTRYEGKFILPDASVMVKDFESVTINGATYFRDVNNIIDKINGENAPVKIQTKKI